MKNIGKILGLVTVLSMTTGIVTAKATTLDGDARKAVYIALDDEYKSWSLYKNIIEKHGNARPFSNIIQAEKYHQGMLAKLMETYGLSVPPNPYENGTKASPVTPSSVLEACKAGVQAEIDNGALYNDKILPAVQKYTDVTALMTVLRDASLQRHLPAFERCVSRDGKMGRGGRQGYGGMGHGQGHGMGKHRW